MDLQVWEGLPEGKSSELGPERRGKELLLERSIPAHARARGGHELGESGKLVRGPF